MFNAACCIPVLRKRYDVCMISSFSHVRDGFTFYDEPLSTFRAVLRALVQRRGCSRPRNDRERPGKFLHRWRYVYPQRDATCNVCCECYLSDNRAILQRVQDGGGRRRYTCDRCSSRTQGQEG